MKISKINNKTICLSMIYKKYLRNIPRHQNFACGFFDFFIVKLAQNYILFNSFFITNLNSLKMKKLLLFRVLFLSLAVQLVSCSKHLEGSNGEKMNNVTEQVNLKNGNALSLMTDGNVLIFQSVEDYERAFQADPNLTDEEIRSQQNSIEATIRSLNFDKFTSSTTYSNMVNEGKNEEYPAFVLKVLNKDGIVQIGQFLFKLDFTNQKAYSLPICMKGSKYNDLKFGLCDQTNVKEYSWDEEVVYEAHGDAYKLGCNEVGQIKPDEDKGNIPDVFEWEVFLNGNINGPYNLLISGKRFSGNLVAKYRLSPLGWDLYSKVSLREINGTATASSNGDFSLGLTGSNAQIELKLDWQRRYKLKCKDDTGYNSYSQTGTGVITGQSWQGVRACNKYILGASAKAKVNGNWEYLDFYEPLKNVNGTLYQVRINKGY